jgi:hypothetical protein
VWRYDRGAFWHEISWRESTDQEERFFPWAKIPQQGHENPLAVAGHLFAVAVDRIRFGH